MQLKFLLKIIPAFKLVNKFAKHLLLLLFQKQIK